jgi:hypothetical protein
MYQGMQKYYHLGLVFGVVAIGIFAFAFRCWAHKNTYYKVYKIYIICIESKTRVYDRN